MSYNVSYTTLPTFTSSSIGYSQDVSGTFTIPNTADVTSVCNFNLGIGVYIVTVNIYNLISQTQNCYWYGGLSNSATTITKYTSSPQWGIAINSFISSINFASVIPQNTAGILYVNIQPTSLPSLTPQPCNYNCSIVRIA